MKLIGAYPAPNAPRNIANENPNRRGICPFSFRVSSLRAAISKRTTSFEYGLIETKLNQTSLSVYFSTKKAKMK